MTANESARGVPATTGTEPTTVMPDTGAQLGELEQLQQALVEADERAKNHWEQYLRAVAELDNVLIFVKVAQFESITRAARSLGMPISTVSRRREAPRGGLSPGV